MTITDDPLTVPCRICKVPVGQRCTRRRATGDVDESHAARIETAHRRYRSERRKLRLAGQLVDEPTETSELLPVTTTLEFPHDGDLDPLKLKEIAELCSTLSAYGAPGSRICGLEMGTSRLTVRMQ